MYFPFRAWNLDLTDWNLGRKSHRVFDAWVRAWVDSSSWAFFLGATEPPPRLIALRLYEVCRKPNSFGQDPSVRDELACGGKSRARGNRLGGNSPLCDRAGGSLGGPDARDPAPPFSWNSPAIMNEMIAT